MTFACDHSGSVDEDFCHRDYLAEVTKAFGDGSNLAVWLYIAAAKDRSWPEWVHLYLAEVVLELISRAEDPKGNRKLLQALKIKKPQRSLDRVKPLFEEFWRMKSDPDGWARRRWLMVDEKYMHDEDIIAPLMDARQLMIDAEQNPKGQKLSAIQARELVAGRLRLSDESSLRRRIRRKRKRHGFT